MKLLPSWDGSLVYCWVANLKADVRFKLEEREPSPPDKPLLVQVDLQWVNPSEENIEPEVELASVDEQRVGDVLLHAHLCLLVWDLLWKKAL